MRQLFEAVARAGALLVMYHTDTDIRVLRKVEGQVELEDARAHGHRHGASPRHHAMAESRV